MAPMPLEGDRAPDFILPSSDGTDVSLRSLLGKKVILYFYPKDDTPGCTTEACAFNAGLSQIRRKGAVVLGVSADSIASHRKFADKFELSFPLLSDESRKTLKAYGVWQEKSFMGRKYFGIVRTTFLIDEKGKVLRVFPKVRVAQHTDEVLALL
jgi:thioredoxin-dependent peroxiredoxin